MKLVTQIPAYLLALVFIVFGSAYFLKLIPTPAMTGDPATFMDLFSHTGYMAAIKVFEVVGGLLMLFPRTRAIGYCIITPIALNIVLYEFLIAHQPGIGIVILLLCVLGIYRMKDRFAGIFP